MFFKNTEEAMAFGTTETVAANNFLVNNDLQPFCLDGYTEEEGFSFNHGCYFVAPEIVKETRKTIAGPRTVENLYWVACATVIGYSPEDPDDCVEIFRAPGSMAACLVDLRLQELSRSFRNP